MFTTATADGYRELLPGVRLRTLVHGERTLMGEFQIDAGAVIPAHQHPSEQTGYLVSGRLRFEVEGVATVAAPGDSWNLASGVVHGATALEDVVVIEVFSPPRKDYLAESRIAQRIRKLGVAPESQ